MLSSRTTTFALPAEAAPGGTPFLRFLGEGPPPETVGGVVAVGTGRWREDGPCVVLSMHFVRDDRLYLPAGNATELAKGLRWHAALAAGPGTGPEEDDEEGWEVWRTDKAWTCNPLPHGGWVQVFATMRDAAGSVVLAAYEMAVLSPEQAGALADALDRADLLLGSPQGSDA